MKEVRINIKSVIKKILPGHLPEFLIVGAQKAATTSLHYYLSQHPRIIGSHPKEVRFFDRDENYERGLKWYKHNFPNTKKPFGNFKYFEATPEYLYRSYVPKRIHAMNKDMKIVIVLRDPVHRAYSAWLMYRQFGRRRRLPEVMNTGYLKGVHNNILREFYQLDQFPSFGKVVEEDILKYDINSPIEEPSIVRRGVYYPQVKRYLDLFGKDQVLILGFNDLIGKKQIETLNTIINFIDLPACDWKFLKAEQRNKSRNKEVMTPDLEAHLRLFYEEHNNQLFELIGFKPNW